MITVFQTQATDSVRSQVGNLQDYLLINHSSFCDLMTTSFIDTYHHHDLLVFVSVLYDK